jgi:PAS domain S-box-containing protein
MVGTFLALDVIAREVAPMPILGMGMTGVLAAAIMNRQGMSKWAGWTAFLSVLLPAILLVVAARDGFRSLAMLLFPSLLLIAVMLLDRVSYIATAATVLVTVAALGIAESHGLTRAIPGVRSPTTYHSIFYVDLILLVFACIGSRIARDAQSNVSDLRTSISRLSAANLELMESAKALRNSELKYRRLYESITDAVVTVDLAGQILETNPAYQSMLGYTGEELRRLTYQELTPEPWHDFEAKIATEQILRKGQSEIYEKECRRRDGTVFPVELQAYLLRNEADQPVGMWAIIRDITERKRIESERRASELQYKEIFDNFSECIFVLEVTPDGRFKVAGFNPAEERALGLSNAEVAGRFIDEVLPEDTAECMMTHYRRCLEVGRVIHYDEQLSLVTGTRYFHTNLIPVRNEAGRIHRIVGCCMDFSELKRAQEESFGRQKLESLGTLASGIAHDFNNLLGAVLAQADLAVAEYTDGASPTEPLTAIQKMAIRGSEIVRQLMAYAGIDSEALEMVDVTWIVEEMVGLLEVSVSKHAALQTDLGRRLPAVKGRAAQLRQIVMNLVTNASEAIGDRDGIIRLTTRAVTVGPAANIWASAAEGDYVELAVSDTGAGMSPEIRARVLDPFFSTKSAGRGLGLWVVHGIVQSLGGAIHILSEPGNGTKVQVLLPCTERIADAATEPVPGAGNLASLPQRFTVLVVEDEDSLREAVTKVLRREGFDVLEASNGTAAVNLLRAYGGDVDVLLLDMTIPGASSQEIVTQAANAQPEIKVILTSAYSQEMILERICTPQISSFVRKPFRLADLVKTLQDAVAS